MAFKGRASGRPFANLRPVPTKLAVCTLLTLFGACALFFPSRSSLQTPERAAVLVKDGWHVGQLQGEVDQKGRERETTLVAQINGPEVTSQGSGAYVDLLQPVKTALLEKDRHQHSTSKGSWEMLAVHKLQLPAEETLVQKLPAPRCRLDLEEGNIACCGHRGAREHAPENTIAGFLLALEQGANCVELDLAITRDNHLVVLHDKTRRAKLAELQTGGQVKASRNVANHSLATAGEGFGRLVKPKQTSAGRFLHGKESPNLKDLAAHPIEELTLAEVQAWDAGGWFSSKFRGTKAPVLKEVLEALWDKEALLVLDLKLDQENCSFPIRASCLETETRFAKALVDTLEEISRPGKQLGTPDRSPQFSLLLASFNHALVNMLEESVRTKGTLAGQKSLAGLGYIIHPKDRTPGSGFLDTVQFLCPFYQQTAELVPMWKDKRKVATWVVDDIEIMHEQVALGVSAVITNKPQLCSELCSHTKEDYSQ